MALIKEYFELTKKYQDDYGENTILLMQVGAFFEVYGIYDKDNKRRRLPSAPSGIPSLTITYVGDGIPRHERLRIMDRVSYLVVAGFADVSEADIKAVAGFLDARIPRHEKRKGGAP